jgi:hypothetical protein
LTVQSPTFSHLFRDSFSSPGTQLTSERENFYDSNLPIKNQGLAGAGFSDWIAGSEQALI